MKPFVMPSLLVIGTFFAVGSAGAQSMHPMPKSDVPAALAREAKISLDSARVIARAQLPKATVASEELERENGKLIYSFDMKTAGKSGIDEVNVNAMNGALVGKVGHESAKSEVKEAAAEKGTAMKKPK